MSDFMLWLHANYIKPQLDAVPLEDYFFHFDLLRGELPYALWEELDKCLEFTAIHAFALGFRTGKGLTRHIPEGSPEARSSGPRAARHVPDGSPEARSSGPRESRLTPQ